MKSILFKLFNVGRGRQGTPRGRLSNGIVVACAVAAAVLFSVLLAACPSETSNGDGGLITNAEAKSPTTTGFTVEYDLGGAGVTTADVYWAVQLAGATDINSFAAVKDAMVTGNIVKVGNAPGTAAGTGITFDITGLPPVVAANVATAGTYEVFIVAQTSAADMSGIVRVAPAAIAATALPTATLGTIMVTDDLRVIGRDEFSVQLTGITGNPTTVYYGIYDSSATGVTAANVKTGTGSIDSNADTLTIGATDHTVNRDTGTSSAFDAGDMIDVYLVLTIQVGDPDTAAEINAGTGDDIDSVLIMADTVDIL